MGTLTLLTSPVVAGTTANKPPLVTPKAPEADGPSCEQKLQVYADLLNQSIPVVNKLETVINEQQTEISELDKSLQDDAAQMVKEKQELGAWYHNPAITAPVAAVLGILAYSYLSHK